MGDSSQTVSRLQRLVTCSLLLTVVGCGLEQTFRADSSRHQASPAAEVAPQPVVAKLHLEVRGDLERHLAVQSASVLKALSEGAAFRAKFKQPLVVQGLTEPWQGLTDLERQGSRLTEAARSGLPSLPRLIESLGGGMGRLAESPKPVPPPTGGVAEDQVAFITAVLQQAHQLRGRALRTLNPDDQRFLFDHAATLVETFVPQISEWNEQTMQQATADLRFCQLVAERLDYGALAAAAQVLAGLADERWLALIESAFNDRRVLPAPPAGVTGDVLLTRETPSGLIVIGGSGPNDYDLDQPVAVVIDLGGDDTYRGRIAAAADPAHGISIVIDLGGQDTYHAAPLGLATGRLGVGLLVDRAGDDLYELAQGAGGTGFAGLGILVDMAGNDRYVGAKLTQGAAIAGAGLLVDRAGDDTLTSFGYAIGFGGPLGVGAVMDLAGNDRYQCGGQYPSVYNDADAPGGKPGDSLFQYDCFGIGAGSGKRIFSKDPQQQSFGLAGGLGVMIDLDGHDRYRSANFAQGAGYFFGAGLKLDLAGNDEHAAARYGHAAGAHDSVGLFIDYGGRDLYISTGPVYNGGAAWDRSVMLCIDAGEDDDLYDLRRSDGLARADHHSWSLFIEEGGRDRYLVPNGMGKAGNDSMAGFFDLAGEDAYEPIPQHSLGGRGNGRIFVDQAGGLFLDR